MTSKPSPSLQPSLAFPRASNGQAGPPSAVPSPPRENHYAVHHEHARPPAPVSDAASGPGAPRGGVEDQPSLLEARRQPVGAPPEPESWHSPGSGGEGAPGRFVSRLLAERRPPGAAVPRHGEGLPVSSSAARLAPSVPPIQTSLFSSPVSADSGEGASGAHAVKAPPAPETVLGLDRARSPTGLERLRPAGHRAMETQETTMEASTLASG